LKMPFFSQNSSILCSSFTKSTLGFTFLIIYLTNTGREISVLIRWKQRRRKQKSF
jgi:hypothetical protein